MRAGSEPLVSLTSATVLGPRFGLGEQSGAPEFAMDTERSLRSFGRHGPTILRCDCSRYGFSLDPRIASSVTHAVASAVAPDERGSVPASTADTKSSTHG